MYNDPNQSPPPYGQPLYGPPQQPNQAYPPYSPQPPLDDRTQYARPYPQQPPQYAQPQPLSQYDQTQYAPPSYPGPSIPNLAQPPQQPRKASRRWLWITLCVIVVLGAGSVALYVFVFNAGGGAHATVDAYCQALEQQDYTNAYTYLDDSKLTSVEKGVARYGFIRAWGAVDLTYGRISNYTIVSISSNNATTTATVDFTRRGKVYEQHLRLKQINDVWKIEL